MTAEDANIGDVLVWPKPPQVVPPVGELPFAAPSTRGAVHSLQDDLIEVRRSTTFVRFQYKNPTGGLSWSEPLELVRGQICQLDKETP